MDAADEVGDGGVATDGHHALDAAAPASGGLEPLAPAVAGEQRDQGDRRHGEDDEGPGDVQLEAVGDDADPGEQEEARAGDLAELLAAGAEVLRRVGAGEAGGQRPDQGHRDREPDVRRRQEHGAGPHHHHHDAGDQPDDDVHADEHHAVAAHPAGLTTPADDRARRDVLRRDDGGRDPAGSRWTQLGMTRTSFDEHGPPSPAATTDRDDRATPELSHQGIRSFGAARDRITLTLCERQVNAGGHGSPVRRGRSQRRPSQARSAARMDLVLRRLEPAREQRLGGVRGLDDQQVELLALGRREVLAGRSRRGPGGQADGRCPRARAGSPSCPSSA